MISKPSPRAIVLRAPGTNCDRETAHAFTLAGAHADLVHVNRLLENSRLLADYQILCLPGGFSFGDDIAAGRILASRIRHHLQEAVVAFRDAGKLVLGICNGFQTLIKSGVLLRDDPHHGPWATLTWNDSGRFEDRWVRLSVDGDKSVFLNGIRSIVLPIAHAEGKFVTRDADALGSLDQNGQLVLRYTERPGQWQQPVRFPFNPNGSQANVAAMCDETGRILGMMPHPERYIDPTQHPCWTREDVAEEDNGMRLFQNAVRYFE